jgi:hypothetical protein
VLARLGANMPDPFSMFGGLQPADSRRIHSRKMKSKPADVGYPIPEPDGSGRASVMPVPKYKTVNGVTLRNPDYKPVNVPKYKTVNGVTLLNPDYKPVNVPKYKTVNGLTVLNPEYGKTSSKPLVASLVPVEDNSHWSLTHLPQPDHSPPKKPSANVLDALRKHDDFRRLHDPSHPEYRK